MLGDDAVQHAIGILGHAGCSAHIQKWAPCSSHAYSWVPRSCMLRQKQSCARCWSPKNKQFLPAAWRSCWKARNGAMPKSRPTMMIGVSPLLGVRKALLGEMRIAVFRRSPRGRPSKSSTHRHLFGHCVGSAQPRRRFAAKAQRFPAVRSASGPGCFHGPAPRFDSRHSGARAAYS